MNAAALLLWACVALASATTPALRAPVPDTAAAPVPAAAAAPVPRSALMWLVPYSNLTTVEQYASAWSQLGAAAKGRRLIFAASAYALKAENASLGYATTPAGEATGGLQMETLGFPALRAMNVTLVAMVYVTHSAAIATMLQNPAPFIAELVAKAEEQRLAGFDIDYEPQGVAALGLGAAFMQFLTTLSAALATQGRFVTIDIGGCDPSFFAFDCAGLSDPTVMAGLRQVNTMDSFGASNVATMQRLLQSDGAALAGRWAPGFEPGNIGETSFAAIAAFLTATPSVRTLSTWAVHEYNVGPQPDWLLAGITAFLDAP